jgi:hypothetical protein
MRVSKLPWFSGRPQPKAWYVWAEQLCVYAHQKKLRTTFSFSYISFIVHIKDQKMLKYECSDAVLIGRKHWSLFQNIKGTLW